MSVRQDNSHAAGVDEGNEFGLIDVEIIRMDA